MHQTQGFRIARQLIEAKLTYWGAATVEIDIGDSRFCFDPYLQPDRPVHYVFVTHEHYDHFHEPTLKRLAGFHELRLVVASKSCFVASRLRSPTALDPRPEDLRWLEPERTVALYPHVSPGDGTFPGPTRLDLGRLEVTGISSGENPLRWADGSLIRPDYAGPERAGFYGPIEQPPCPTVGYLVTDRASGLSIYHPGDLDQVFPELSQLRGRVTHLLLPIGKLEGQEAELIDLVAPRFVIPIHYRLDVPDWPHEWVVSEEEIRYAQWESGHPKPGVRGDDPRYLGDVERLIRGHWYPSPRDPLGFLRGLKRRTGDIATIVLLNAGREHTLDPCSGAIAGANVIDY